MADKSVPVKKEYLRSNHSHNSVRDFDRRAALSVSSIGSAKHTRNGAGHEDLNLIMEICDTPTGSVSMLRNRISLR